MSKKPDDEIFEDFEEADYGVFEKLDQLDVKQNRLTFKPDARRTIERLREEKELERLVNSNYYDWD